MPPGSLGANTTSTLVSGPTETVVVIDQPENQVLFAQPPGSPYPQPGAIDLSNLAQLIPGAVETVVVVTPSGPPGPPGPSGPEGPAGRSGISTGTQQSVWQWEGSPTTEPFTGIGLAGTNEPPREATELWLQKQDYSLNVDQTPIISRIVAGDQIYLQTKENAQSWHRYLVTTPPEYLEGTWHIGVATDDGSPVGTEPIVGAEIVVAFQYRIETIEGPPGPAGPPGPEGPPGPAAETVSSYRFYMPTAAEIWVIIHPLPFRPSVTVVDSTGREVWPGDIEYLSDNTIRLIFSAAFGGEAYLS